MRDRDARGKLSALEPIDYLGSILVVAPVPLLSGDPDRVHHVAAHHGFQVFAELARQEIGEHVGGIVAVEALGAGAVDEPGRAAVVEAGGHRRELSDRDLAEPVRSVLRPLAAKAGPVHSGLVVEPDQRGVDCKTQCGRTEGGLGGRFDVGEGLA